MNFHFFMSPAKRIMQELTEFGTEDSGEIELHKVKSWLLMVSPGLQVGDDLTRLLGVVKGPEGTPYEGGTFHIKIDIPEGYPWLPPNMGFLTKVTNTTSNIPWPGVAPEREQRHGRHLPGHLGRGLGPRLQPQDRPDERVGAAGGGELLQPPGRRGGRADGEEARGLRRHRRLLDQGGVEAQNLAIPMYSRLLGNEPK